jgi:ribonuclease HI
MALKHVTIYTDGACLGNPGPGGYGVVLLHGSHRKELSGGFRLTTNNRMEILAAVIGLEALKRPCTVTLFSDSQYLVNAVQQGWAARWRANGWKRNKKEAALNPDLWERLLCCLETTKSEFRWVRGHAGNPENERCDQLAMSAAKSASLGVDSGYEEALNRHPL